MRFSSTQQPIFQLPRLRRCVFVYIFLIILLLLKSNQYAAAQQTQSTGKMDEIIKLIKKNYVDSVNVDSIVHSLVADFLNKPSTIDSLFSKLDPHSSYMNKAYYSQFKRNIENKLVGIGIEFTIVHDTAIVVNVLSGGPAEKAGLKTGDKIIKINDDIIPKKDLPFDDIIAKLIGEKETHVKITVQRNKPADLFPVEIIRDTVALKSVLASYIIAKGTGDILISYFAKSTAAEVHESLRELNRLGMKKLILDLRDNPGGLVRAAVSIADEFLAADKLIVSEKGRDSNSSAEYAKTPGLFENGEMIVLINESSGSAAEILAAALQDNKRAKMIGRRSYGKGLVQLLYPLSDSGSAIKLTVARYYTPSGKCIQRPFDKGMGAYLNDYHERVKNNGEITGTSQASAAIQWGVQPDLYVPDDTTSGSKLFNQLYLNYYISGAAYYYYATNPAMLNEYNSPEEFKKKYRIDNKLFDELKKYTASEDLKIKDSKQRLIYKDADFNSIQSKLELAMKAFIAREKWKNEGLYYILNEGDADINTAIKELQAK
ncbi:MAG TPA: S41 family peptidase [Chitinophagaceae bacterium]|nr:S41 family peptidase [Chitinophagaceae bacterium]